MPLQTISYDRTVVIDTSGKTEDAILASMPKSGKRSIRSGLKKGKAEGVTFHEDTANAAEVIDEYYARHGGDRRARRVPVLTPRTTT